MSHDFCIEPVGEVSRVFNKRLDKLLRFGDKSSSMFCLGYNKYLIERNLGIFFSVTQQHLSAMGLQFNRNAEKTILRAYKVKHSDRISLNRGETSEMDTKEDVVRITILAGKNVPPTLVMSHFHVDKLKVVSFNGNKDIVMPADMTVVQLTNSQEAFIRWANVQNIAPSIHSGVAMEEIQNTIAAYKNKGPTVKPSYNRQKLTIVDIDEADDSACDDFEIPKNVSHEADISHYFKPKTNFS